MQKKTIIYQNINRRFYAANLNSFIIIDFTINDMVLIFILRFIFKLKFKLFNQIR